LFSNETWFNILNPNQHILDVLCYLDTTICVAYPLHTKDNHIQSRNTL